MDILRFTQLPCSFLFLCLLHRHLPPGLDLIQETMSYLVLMSFEEFVSCWTLCLGLINVSVFGLPSWKEKKKELYYLFVWGDIAIFPTSEYWYVNYQNLHVSNQRLGIWGFIGQGNYVSANVLIDSLLNRPHLLSPVVMWVPVWLNAIPVEFSKGSFSLFCQMCKVDSAELCSECPLGLEWP